MLNYDLWKQFALEDGYIEEQFNEQISHPHKSTAIVLNFVDDNNHGCDTNCKFCKWRSLNFNPYLYPDDAIINEFIDNFCTIDGYVELTGGGDPLYQFEKNKEKVKHLIDLIIQKNRVAKIVTTKIDVVDQYYNSEYLKDVTIYSFSLAYLSATALETINKLLAAGKKVYISNVLNFSNNVEEIDKDRIIKYLNFYYHDANIYDDRFKIILRLNYNYTDIDVAAARQLVEDLKASLEKNIWVVVPNLYVHMYQLIDNYVLWCCNTNRYLDWYAENRDNSLNDKDSH